MKTGRKAIFGIGMPIETSGSKEPAHPGDACNRDAERDAANRRQGEAGEGAVERQADSAEELAGRAGR